MTDIQRQQIRLGLALLIAGIPLMLPGMVGSNAEPLAFAIAKAIYLAGLALMIAGNVLTLRALGPGPWRTLLATALVLDGLACVHPLAQITEYLWPDIKETMEMVPWGSLASVPLHVAAAAMLLWALGEICFAHKIPYRRPQLIQFGICCLGAAIFFFVTAEAGEANSLFVALSLLGQLALIFPIVQVRRVLGKDAESKPHV